jgi:hypothetical protein
MSLLFLVEATILDSDVPYARQKRNGLDGLAHGSPARHPNKTFAINTVRRYQLSCDMLEFVSTLF